METLYFGKTFDEIFEKAWRKFTRNVEEKDFNHFNRSLGMRIHSKEQLKHEMKRKRMLSMDICEDLAEEWDKKNQRKEYKVSDSTLDIIKSVRMSADRHGNIQLGGRAINKLIEMGAIQSPTTFRGLQGGFND